MTTVRATRAVLVKDSISISTSKDPEFTSLQNVVTILSHLVTVDVQAYERVTYMKLMLPRVEHVIKCVNNTPGSFENLSLSVKLDLIRLFEVYGMVKLTRLNSKEDQKDAEVYLKMSLDDLWREIVRLSNSDLRSFDDLMNQNSDDSSPEKNRAKQIIDACQKAGKALHKSQFDISAHFHSIPQIWARGCGIPLNEDRMAEWDKFLQSCLKHEIEKNQVQLPLPQYYLFLIRRLVSIMYSLGRVMFYDAEDSSPDRHDYFRRLADITHYVCEFYLEDTGKDDVSFFLLGRANAIDVRLKRTGKSIEEDKRKILSEIRVLQERTVRYVKGGFHMENVGVDQSNVWCNFLDITALRSLVRSNAKRWRLLNEEEKKSQLQWGDSCCESLLQKAENTLKTLKISSSCYVYVGKYYAAKESYYQAIVMFDKALGLRLSEVDKTKFFPWVCYNYARAVSVSKSKAFQEKAKKYCKDALILKKDISNDLACRLDGQLTFALTQF